MERQLLDGEGQVLASVSKTAPFAECGHVRFALPQGGVPVAPGQSHRGAEWRCLYPIIYFWVVNVRTCPNLSRFLAVHCDSISITPSIPKA